MHASAADTASVVIFGWDPLWVASLLFLATYAAIISEKVNRAIVSMLGAGLMIMLGVLSQDTAISGIDFNTLGLLSGMMVIVAITKRSGVFQYIAVWSTKKVRANPWGILLMLASVTAVFSALLDNVTTVLLIAPVTLLICHELDLDPYPFLFAEIFTSNIGGAATLIGDPPNIMIGSAAHLTFNDFLVNIAPVIPLIMIVTLAIIYLLWGRKLHATEDARARIMQFREKEAITDPRLLKQSLLVLALVIAGFTMARPLRYEPASIALFGAALLLLLDNLGDSPETQSERVQKTLGKVEWLTIFFFVGLFVSVKGLEEVGLLEILANGLLELTGSNLTATAHTVLWTSAIVSSIIDNIPFVATMIPLIKSMTPTFGGSEQLLPLWWSLALGACLGGNGSLVGASANLIVAGYAERSGHRIGFLKFLLAAFPMMILSIIIASVYIHLRYL